MSFLGMEIGEVGRAKKGVGETAGVIGEMTTKITQFVRGLQDDADRKWTGPDADKFFGRFEELAPLTNDASERLGHRTGELQKRIAAQLEASRATQA